MPATQICTVHFRVLPTRVVSKLLARGGDAALLGAAVGGWEGIRDVDGASIAYSQKALAAVAAVPYFSKAAVAAYFGRVRPDPVKNS